MDIIKFIIRTILKLLMFTITISFAVLKFVIIFALMIFTLGAFGSRTSKY
ncbi:hypothetical protein NQ113_24945 [Bacillus pseudomycoides]|nr:hypothetical protein [Bacillus pseudomycoides]KFN13777.1 hypothetical protein DJ94_4481 [Bacillus pseudomycoides]MCR8860423.1 hypothetical protein [Bacillus pseudomycoides]